MYRAWSDTGSRSEIESAMLIRLIHGDSRPIYVQIMDEIRRAIVVGTLAPDDALPSLRQLAGELRVNPNTVQLAYRELQRAGVVYARRGQGMYVAASSGGNDERPRLARDVALRALRDAHRHGITVDELIAGLRAAAAHWLEKSDASATPTEISEL
jgi:GntR family transcriptional regulator